MRKGKSSSIRDRPRIRVKFYQKRDLVIEFYTCPGPTSMSTPKGMRHVAIPLVSGDHVMLYSNAENIILQLRRQVPTEAVLLEPSFKVAVQLSPAEAAKVAWELLNRT